jgi:hypothetical protein
MGENHHDYPYMVCYPTRVNFTENSQTRSLRGEKKP